MIDDTITEPKAKSKSAYSKRYPTDCKDKTPNTKHMLNDKNVNIKLYSIFQQYSYAVEIIDEDTGKRIRTETRVNKEGFPTKKQLGIMLGEEKVQADGTTKIVPMSQPTVRKYWNYLLNPSEENQYCPYVIERDEYYVLPERESKFSLIPASIVHFMNKFCSPEEMKTYLFLYSMNHWFHHKMAERRKAMPPEMVEWETKEKDCFVFTLKEVACNIGISIAYWDTRPDLWAFDIDKFENDPQYQLGLIPMALLGLKTKA